MRNLIAALLLCASPIAAAEYTLTAHDFTAGTTYRFEGCVLGLHAFEPGQEEASYLYLTCPDYPSGAAITGPAISLPTSAFEEVAISYGKAGYMERLDCYLARIVHDNKAGHIVIECGDIH